MRRLRSAVCNQRKSQRETSTMKTTEKMLEELAETLLTASLLLKEIIAAREEAKQQINRYNFEDKQ